MVLALLGWRKILLLRSEQRMGTQEALLGLGKLCYSKILAFGEVCRRAERVSFTYNCVTSSGISQDVV